MASRRPRVRKNSTARAMVSAGVAGGKLSDLEHLPDHFPRRSETWFLRLRFLPNAACSSLPASLWVNCRARAGTIKVCMKLSEFARVLALSGLAAAAMAQQPTPATPAAAAPSTPPPLTARDADEHQCRARHRGSHHRRTRNITRAQFEMLLVRIRDNGRPANTAAQKRQVAEQYAELETWLRKPASASWMRSPEVKQMMAIQSDSVLANTLAKADLRRHAIQRARLRSYYDPHKDEFEEAKGSHILIRFKGSTVPLKPDEKDLTAEEALAKAQDIRKQILAGADFAAIAKAESDDAGSGGQGRRFGSASRHGQMVAQFDQAAFSLPVGEVSEPVKNAVRLSHHQSHVAQLPRPSTRPSRRSRRNSSRRWPRKPWSRSRRTRR